MNIINIEIVFFSKGISKKVLKNIILLNQDRKYKFIYSDRVYYIHMSITIFFFLVFKLNFTK